MINAKLQQRENNLINNNNEMQYLDDVPPALMGKNNYELQRDNIQFTGGVHPL